MEMGFHLKMAFLLSSVLLCGYLVEGLTKFSELKNSLNVDLKAANGTKAGAGQIEVSMTLNTEVISAEEASATYMTVQYVLCFGQVSQVDRPWRKTNDVLAKDKTCLFKLGSQSFTVAGNNFTWTVTKDIPFAYYFIRAYVTNAAEEKIAYGQTSDANKVTNLFTIEPITGRHASMDIAAGVFSAFAIISLFGLYFVEKRSTKKGA
eukprot:c19648_g1_i1 orf=204-821(-)